MTTQHLTKNYSPTTRPVPSKEIFLRKMILDVEFEKPSKNCEYTGIGRIYSIGKAKPSAKRYCPHARVLVTYAGDGFIEFEFIRPYLLPQVEEKYFGTGYFQVSEPIEIPLSISRQLTKGQTKIKIQSGSYPVFNKGLMLKTRFECVHS